MSRDDERAETPARVLLAVPRGPLRDRLLALLEEADVEVETEAGDPGALDAQIREADADLVVVRRGDLSSLGPGPLDELATDDEAPDVLVVGPDLDAADRVRLVSAGATEALRTDALDEEAAKAIESLAERTASHAAPDRGEGAGPTLADFTSRSKRMQSFVELVGRVADTDSTLLITGETGVGKEHLARAIHAASGRRAGPFVLVNCGALPEQLLESELFGHRKGAFTGAQEDRRGCFEQAAGGTLLLDEIGEMPKHLQVKLLTALQRHEIQPLGAEAPVQVDVRILAATNRELQADVAAGEFREDLYYRLNVVELAVPPLRDRKEDLPVLIGSLLRHFRSRLGREDVPRLDDAALERLMAHDWPGNVRELINVVERASLVCDGDHITSKDLPATLDAPAPAPSTDETSGAPDWEGQTWKEVRASVLEATERAYLDHVLQACRGAISEAAARAGLSARSLYDKMKRHDLQKEDYK